MPVPALPGTHLILVESDLPFAHELRNEVVEKLILI